jgi:ABC-type amino acid transport substrate-binding protein
VHPPAGDQAIKEGVALRPLDPAAYVAFISGALDRSSSESLKAFAERVDEILSDLHLEGTLRRLSTKYFGRDYATPASAFDLESIGQTVG